MPWATMMVPPPTANPQQHPSISDWCPDGNGARGNGGSLSYLPFLGETQIVQGEKRGDRVEFTLPPLECSAVVSVIGERCETSFAVG